MRLALALPLLVACGSSSPKPAPPSNTDDGAPEAPAGGRLAAPPAPDATQRCDVFTTITLDLVYDGACPAPASLSIDYNPTASRPIALTDGTYDEASVMLEAPAFEPQGCRGQLVYEAGDGTLELEFYASGPEEIAGTGTWRDESGSECPARITGGWKTWTKE